MCVRYKHCCVNNLSLLASNLSKYSQKPWLESKFNSPLQPLHNRSLESCAYSANVLKETLHKIQKAVDDLSLRQYSNLHAWVGYEFELPSNWIDLFKLHFKYFTNVILIGFIFITFLQQTGWSRWIKTCAQASGEHLSAPKLNDDQCEWLLGSIITKMSKVFFIS